MKTHETAMGFMYPQGRGLPSTLFKFFSPSAVGNNRTKTPLWRGVSEHKYGHIRENWRDPDGIMSGDHYDGFLKSEYNTST
jgi:hypothetical protein